MHDELIQVKDWDKIMDQAGWTTAKWYEQIKNLHPALNKDQIIELVKVAGYDFRTSALCRISDNMSSSLSSLGDSIASLKDDL